MVTLRSTRAWTVVKASLATILLLCGSQVLAAGTASNTQLQNTVTVNFDNAGGTPQTAVTAQVIITIELIKATPTITFSTSIPTNLSTVSETEAVSLIFTITSNANGPDDYLLNVTESSVINIGATTITNPTDVGILGATTVGAGFVITNGGGGGTGPGDCLVADAGICQLVVPNDDASDGAVNGFGGGDTIVFDGGPVCTVTTVNDLGGGNVTNLSGVLGTDFSVINFDNCDGAGASLTFGQSIFERTDVTVALTMGTIIAPPADGTTDIDVTAEPDVGGTPSATVTTAIVVLAADLSVVKYVRNVNDVAQTGTDASPFDVLQFNGATYYRAGITAAPGEVLEYALLMINNGGAIQGVVATDPSIAFTTYVPSPTFGIQVFHTEDITDTACVVSNECVVTNVGGSTSNLDDTLATALDIGGLAGSTITVYAGVGGNEVGAVGGTIAINKVSVVLYRLTVN
ncbi:MAG: hypothetical protein JKY88_16970 [Pseudomonadales bacterium]|nr:hypothetical protein [Pseudomonadales bacterium]